VDFFNYKYVSRKLIIICEDILQIIIISWFTITVLIRFTFRKNNGFFNLMLILVRLIFKILSIKGLFLDFYI